MQLVNENDEQTNKLKQRKVIPFTLIRLQANRTYREENIKQIKERRGSRITEVKRRKKLKLCKLKRRFQQKVIHFFLIAFFMI